MRAIGLVIAPRRVQPIVWLLAFGAVWSVGRLPPARVLGDPGSSAEPLSVGTPRLHRIANPLVVTVGAQAGAPLSEFLAPGRPSVVLVMTPGCRACYPQVSNLELVRAARPTQANVLLLVTGSSTAGMLLHAAQRISSEFGYGGTIAVDPGKEASKRLGDSPLQHPYTMVLDRDQRVVAVATGYFPGSDRLLPILDALADPAPRLPTRVPGFDLVDIDPGALRESIRWVQGRAELVGREGAVLVVGMERTPSCAWTLCEAASLAQEPTPVTVSLIGAEANNSSASDLATLEGLGRALSVPVGVDASGLLAACLGAPDRPLPWVVCIPPGDSPSREALVLTEEARPFTWALVGLWLGSVREGVRGRPGADPGRPVGR